MNRIGWPDIGYNWLVGEDGRAYEGRGWDKIGAHTYGYNDVAVAVSVIGDFTSRVPNAAAQSALVNIFNCAIQQVRLHQLMSKALARSNEYRHHLTLSQNRIVLPRIVLLLINLGHS